LLSEPDVPPLGPGGAQVWWARPLGLETSELAHSLNPAERGRRDAYRREQDRARFTVAAALLRLVGGAHLGVTPERLTVSRSCPDCERPHGRPTLSAGWECSVSHSGDRVAVAIGRTGPLGVDVEDCERRSAERDANLVDTVLTAEEAAELARYGRPDGLLTYWTRKEAVLKATGEGLRIGLRQVVVSAPDAPPALVRSGYDAGLPARARLQTLSPGTGYLACLAVLDTPAPGVTEIDATALLQRAAGGAGRTSDRGR
jgi:4'-phosphopantetheinyl transferase